ncbi:MAG: hypothetical protein ACI9DO_001439 [Reinekea sp.]
MRQAGQKLKFFQRRFFILFGVMFILASAGFWNLGKTDIAKAYIIPTLVAGALLTIIGLGLFFTNKARIVEFEKAYNQDPSAFVSAEIARAESTLNEYKTIVFKAVPFIIAACALIIVFSDAPVWRASVITTIAMLVVILLIDGTAHARVEAYYEQLISVERSQT